MDYVLKIFKMKKTLSYNKYKINAKKMWFVLRMENIKIIFVSSVNKIVN